MTAQVGIIMGSKSDWDTMKHASEMFDKLGVAHEVKVVSAHRTPDLLFEYAGSAADRGLKVIIAESECMLAKQRRVKAERTKLIREGKRAVRPRFGIDDDVCTGDHSCIRLSGCPSLTIKANPDPLRTDPIAHVNTGCVGCGLCGEVAHAAILCPSFYKAEIVYNAGGEPSVVVAEVRKGKQTHGFNARTGVFTDLVADGVIDPTKVVRTALENASSVAGMMLTTEAMIAEAPKKEAPAAAGGHDHGMGGMGM